MPAAPVSWLDTNCKSTGSRGICGDQDHVTTIFASDARLGSRRAGNTCVVLLMTCAGVVWLDTSVPLTGFPTTVWLVEVMMTVALSASAGAGASELSSCELTCDSSRIEAADQVFTGGTATRASRTALCSALSAHQDVY